MELTATKPKARREGLSVTVAGTETLVYDPEQFMIHRLGTETATIWQLADGSRDVFALQTAAETELDRFISTGAVEDILLELSNLGLIDGVSAKEGRISRRMLVGGALGVAAASSYIPVSAASPVGVCDTVAAEAYCHGRNQYYVECVWRDAGPWGPANWYATCFGEFENPGVQSTTVISMGSGLVVSEDRIESPESAQTQHSSTEVETIQVPFEEVPTPEPTQVPTESPTVEGAVDALSKPTPSETLPPTEPVTVETVPPAEPAVTTQGDEQSVPVVEEAAPVAPTPAPTPVPTEPAVIQQPVVVEEPIPAAPNVDTSIEVEVVIDD